MKAEPDKWQWIWKDVNNICHLTKGYYSNTADAIREIEQLNCMFMIIEPYIPPEEQ